MLRKLYMRSHVMLMALLAGMLLMACQTPPPVKSQFTPEQISVLQELGFQEVDDAWALNLGGSILFATGADRLTEDDRGVIKKIAGMLHAIGIDHMRIEGHTDNVGTESFNVELSLRRAVAVAQEMTANGIPRENIQTRGLGTSHPIADNGSIEGRVQNRRASIIVMAE